MQEESDQPVPPPPVRFPGDGLPPIEIFPACKPDEPSVQALSPEENQRVNESLRRAILRHQEQQSTEPEQSKLDKIANRKPRSSVKSTTALKICMGLSLLLMLSQPLIPGAGRCGVILLAGCFAYSFSIDSDIPFADIVKNALITCLVIGGLCFITHGDEVRDDAGGIVSEGFETSFDQKAGSGVRVFAGLFIGALAGVLLADRHKRARQPQK